MAHEIWMYEALALAERGRGWVSPNPMVGAVVVRDGNVVGRGWHREFGGPHAEVFALREAGEAARGAALYCSLEPCNHSGKTPPCTRAVIEAGIARVVLGARDANPVAAGGVDVLRAAGIEVIEGVRERECRRLNAAFFKVVATGMPLVTLKWAMSLDGRTATRTGDSKWITDEAARALVHRMRAKHDAVMVGVGTVLADDPALNARIETATVLGAPETRPTIKQPRRVILDSSARTPLDRKLWSAQPAEAITIVVARPLDAEAGKRAAALRAKGAEVIEVARDTSGVSMPEALSELAKRGVLSVFGEGGALTHGSLIDARLVDRVCAFIAPKIIGGEDARGAVEGIGVERMSEAQLLRPESVVMQQIGGDYLIEGAVSEWGE